MISFLQAIQTLYFDVGFLAKDLSPTRWANKRMVAMFCAIFYATLVRDINIISFFIGHMGVASNGTSPTIGAGINSVLPKVQQFLF
jgi:hypothetical protein